MKHLLDLLKYEYPLVIADTVLRKRISPAEFESLLADNLLRPHSLRSAVICARCFQAHEVFTSNLPGRDYYYVCGQPQGELEVVQAEELRCWRFDIEALLALITRQLGIQANVQLILSSVLWRLGGLAVHGTGLPITCLFCRAKLRTVIRRLLKDYPSEPVALVYVADPISDLVIPNNIACLGLSHLLTGSTSTQLNQAYFTQWLVQRFRQVYFNHENGDLIVNGQRITTAIPSSPQYFFLCYLWEQFDLPVSHEEIFDYCCRELAQRDGIPEWRSEYLPGSFCHTMKRLLKKHSSHRTVLDRVIQVTRTQDQQNAYRLTAP